MKDYGLEKPTDSVAFQSGIMDRTKSISLTFLKGKLEQIYAAKLTLTSNQFSIILHFTHVQ